MPPAKAQRLIESAYSTRQGTDATHLDWLKAPPKRHGPGTLAETFDKVRYLKSLGAHEWDLADIALAKQQAYARQVQARRPVKTREIKATRQTIELVCFLRATLLELTDIALQQSSRRSQQLFREAADRAQARRTRSVTAPEIVEHPLEFETPGKIGLAFEKRRGQWLESIGAINGSPL